MDDKIIRSEVMEDDEKTIKYQVMEKKDDKIIRHQVIGIGEAEPVLETLNVTENGTYTPEAGVDGFDEVKVEVSDIPAVIEPLSVTENGTYTAPSGVDGYSPVTVNVPPSMPNEYLESEFDLLHCNSTDGFTDLVQKYNLATNKYSNFANGYITGRGCKVLCSYLNQGDIKRIVVKTGEFDRTQETSDQTQRLFKFLLGNNHFNIQWDNTREGWTISDASGSPTFIDGSDLPKYSFDDTTIEMVFGAKYINGELYCGTKSGEVITNSFRSRLYVYINGNLVIEAPNEVITGDVNNTIGTIQVAGSYAWVGAKIENLKVYNVLNCYDKFYIESVGE